MSAAFPLALFWEQFAAHGMLETAIAKSRGTTYSGSVGYFEPDVTQLISGQQTKQYVIEYQAADFPALAEGDAVTVKGMKFKVRQPPYVSDNPAEGVDGYFRRALLTKL